MAAHAETEAQGSDQRGALRVLRPLTDFLHQEAGAGVLLVIAAVVAMIWANSPWSDAYFDLFSTEAVIGIGEHTIELTFREWINDLGMVLFFFVAGLEIKRELTQGELRDPKQAALPIVGAFGGMIVPAVVYTIINTGGEGARGWGIPMATDIAIVTGVVAMLGSRAPSWLKLFLLALAIADDIGAIVVIAIFYSEGVSLTWLGVAVGSLAAAAAVRNRVDHIGIFLSLGAVCWFAMHEAHVHPTLTGVAFGMLAPVLPRRENSYIDADELAVTPTVLNARRVADQARASVSVVEWLLYILHPWSAFVVVPLFALANAGISLPADEFDDAFSSPVTWGVILGLVVGKTVGISAATLLAVKLKVGRLPAGVTTRYVIGAGALGGIGFTVSLFVTELAFGDAAVGSDARLGVVVGSLCAAAIGTAICIPGRVVPDLSMDAPAADAVPAGAADAVPAGAAGD